MFGKAAKSKIELGVSVRDKITGFQGVVTAYVQYITGCNQALVQPPVDDDGNFKDSHWFDEQRLELLDANAIEIDNGDTPGFDKAPPTR